jgi:hypothetical protein
MKIHLLPDAGMDIQRVRRIHSLLGETDGPIPFSLHPPVAVHTMAEAAEFDELFKVCSSARTELGLPPTDYLVLLTDRPNRRNFFAVMDSREPRNGFVHAGEWNLYMACDVAVPVAFTVLNLVLLHKTEPDASALPGVLHQKPIGCVNDFCGDKRDVIFKLRTGDICVDCIERMRRKGFSDLYLDHAIRILGHLSGQMKQHFSFKRELPLSRLVIDMHEGTVTLPDYDGIQVDMDQLDLSYYVLLLMFTDGILNDAWVQDPRVKAVWLAAYRVLRPVLGARESEATITAQCASDGERNVRKRKVKEAFERCLGPNIAADYHVAVIRKVCRKVTLPRDLVTIRHFNSLAPVIAGDGALEVSWQAMKATQ